MFLPNPRPSFDAESRKEVAKAVTIAVLSALAVKLVEWGWESIREKWPRDGDDDGDSRGEG